MSARPLLLDFQPRPRNGGPLGAVVLLFGIFGSLLAGQQFRAANLQQQGLELRLEAVESARNAAAGASGPASMEAAGPVVSALGTPWSVLLQELESASQDESGSVAVLAVEPDRDKGRIRIVAEARNLNLVLAYVQRLQKSRALRFPMLDSHEIRTEDRDQPVRFQLSADWNSSI